MDDLLKTALQPERKLSWSLLDKPGRDGIIKHRKGAAAAVSPTKSNQILMLTVWEPAKRSTCFYGEYVGQKDQTH